MLLKSKFDFIETLEVLFYQTIEHTLARLFAEGGDFVDVLEGVGEFCAVKEDAPAKAQPYHEERQGGKDAVDGALLAHHKLGFQVQELDDGKRDARKNSRL